MKFGKITEFLKTPNKWPENIKIKYKKIVFQIN